MFHYCSQTVTYCTYAPLTSVIPSPPPIATFSDGAFQEMMTFEAIPYKYSPDSGDPSLMSTYSTPPPTLQLSVIEVKIESESYAIHIFKKLLFTGQHPPRCRKIMDKN